MHGFFLSFIIQEVFEKIIWDISPLLFTLLKEKKKKNKMWIYEQPWPKASCLPDPFSYFDWSLWINCERYQIILLTWFHYP